MSRRFRSAFALLILPVTVLALPSAASAQEPAPAVEHHLVGTIGPLGVRLALTPEGTKLSGSYVYIRSKPSLVTVLDSLWLEGTVGADGRFELRETGTDAAGNDKVTGMMKGTLVSDADGIRLHGTWSRPDGSKPLSLDASEIRSTASGLRFTTVSYEDGNPRFKKIVTAQYPRFQRGSAPVAALNDAIVSRVQRIVRDYEESVTDLGGDDASDGQDSPDAQDEDSTGGGFALDVDYAVTALTDAVVSIRFEIYNDFGGAHPSSFVETVTFDLSKGRALTLGDLFKKGAPFLKVLSSKASPLFARGDFEAAADTAPTLANYETWYLTRGGLTIVFPVPHVIGDTVEVFLPYAELASIEDPAGPMARVQR